MKLLKLNWKARFFHQFQQFKFVKHQLENEIVHVEFLKQQHENEIVQVEFLNQ